jgi:quercetin 2,3-dioxygenase
MRGWRIAVRLVERKESLRTLGFAKHIDGNAVGLIRRGNTAVHREQQKDILDRGCSWHPHRGIETITYVLAGTVEHRDSLGNKGALGAGDVQWMTAGRGILHQEMPQGDPRGRMHGFQLWANLPSTLKMTAPRYQDIKAGEIPVIRDDDGTELRVICGDFWGKRAPVEGVAADPRYLDVRVPARQRKTLPVETDRHAFAYGFEGSGTFRSASQPFGVLTEKEIDGNEALIRERTASAGRRQPRCMGAGFSIIHTCSHRAEPAAPRQVGGSAPTPAHSTVSL